MSKWILLVSALLFSATLNADDELDPYELKILQAQQALGEPIERVVVINLDGGHQSFDELDSEEVVIYFFASWCSPCFSSLKNIESLKESFQFNTRFLAVALDDDIDAVKAMLDRANFSGEAWLAIDGGELLQNRSFANGYTSLPYAIRLDKHTRIVENSFEVSSVKQWKEILVDGSTFQDMSKF
ncbi:thioredoxin-like domain-containing protein [Shewanella sp. UCD-KL12]|uniref:TlpA family protein disulfide reductase n=1 Tax=Shewanella sp. UCD-KL12 TaxID=1917163 RepID=UPI000970E102|nr:redoxin domain-containing protein [Shewanella sp. UCD-KL12]